MTISRPSDPEVACNSCASSDTTVLFRAGEAQSHQIVRCNKCGLMYASPRPEPPQHVTLAERTVTETEKLLIKGRIEKEKLQVRDYRETREMLNKRFPGRGNLLEIGSGYGYLLSAFERDGWSVKGVDPDYFACDVARENNKVDVFSGILQDMDLPEESMDVVIMNHVIEHIPDPLALISDIRKILRPGGVLVMETPCYDTLMFKLLGRRERSLSCDGHIYFFTTASLKALSEAAGFRQLKTSRVGRSLTFNRLAYNLGVISKSKTIERWLQSVTRALHLHKVYVYLNMRDMQRIYLEK
jgi:2-polyprenyl-3-methyl-5-hydroxy-6-metoxy-1,4-benzoquinol methylase